MFVKNGKKTASFLFFTEAERGTPLAPVASGGSSMLTSHCSKWSLGQSVLIHRHLCLSFVSGVPQPHHFSLLARSTPSAGPCICAFVGPQILRTLATEHSLERWSMVSDVAMVPPCRFMSAEDGSDEMESPCVRQLTEVMTRL